MPLELYVMPLQRFFRGDFEGSDRLGGSQGLEVCDEETAALRLAQLREDLEGASSCSMSWPDEGDQLAHWRIEARHLHALRSFAAHLEYPPKLRLFRGAFRVLDDPRDHKGLRKIYDGSPTAYEHLMRHSDDRGFYFPVDFPTPTTCREAKWWKIGSTQRLHDELVRLESRFDAATPLLVRDTCSLLLEVTGCANERRLPLIWMASPSD